MLKQRVITALVLLAILLPALFYPSPWPFAGVILVLMAAGAWEWGRLNGLGMAASLGLGGVCVLLCGASLALGWAQPVVLTPLCLAATYLCGVGASAYSRLGFWEGTGLAVLCCMLFATYFLWFFVTIR